MVPVELGIDLGTSNTVAFLRRDPGSGPIEPVLFDGAPLLPSAVVLDEHGTLTAGTEALHSARVRPEFFDPNPKRRIDDVTVLLGEYEVPVRDLVGAVLRRVAEEADRVLAARPDVVLTHPAAWGARRCQVLRDAATCAGLAEPALVAEPVAAGTYFVRVHGARLPPGAVAVIYDLGAGTGNVTVEIQRRWPKAHVTGVDSSPAMLTKAKEIPGISWQQADLATWLPDQPADLIYSNAALHWLGDHGNLFLSLLAALAPGGVLAVQMPRNFLAPSHTLVADVARNGPWWPKLQPLVREPPVAEPSFYYELLAPRAAFVDIWETEYLHVLEGEDAVKEWIKGSWMSPLLEALDQPERAQYEAEYSRRAAVAYPRRPDGRTLLPFRRLFMVAAVA